MQSINNPKPDPSIQSQTDEPEECEERLYREESHCEEKYEQYEKLHGYPYPFMSEVSYKDALTRNFLSFLNSRIKAYIFKERAIEIWNGVQKFIQTKACSETVLRSQCCSEYCELFDSDKWYPKAIEELKITTEEEKKSYETVKGWIQDIFGRDVNPFPRHIVQLLYPCTSLHFKRFTAEDECMSYIFENCMCMTAENASLHAKRCIKLFNKLEEQFVSSTVFPSSTPAQPSTDLNPVDVFALMQFFGL